MLLVFAAFHIACAADTEAGMDGSVLDRYFEIQEDLAADNFDDVPDRAEEIVETTNIAAIKEAAQDVQGSQDIDAAREAFKELSNAMILSLKGAENMPSEPAYVIHCPMAKASWLQESKEVRNPYYGAEMLKCGTVKEKLARE